MLEDPLTRMPEGHKDNRQLVAVIEFSPEMTGQPAKREAAEGWAIKN